MCNYNYTSSIGDYTSEISYIMLTYTPNNGYSDMNILIDSFKRVFADWEDLIVMLVHGLYADIETIDEHLRNICLSIYRLKNIYYSISYEYDVYIECDDPIQSLSMMFDQMFQHMQSLVELYSLPQAPEHRPINELTFIHTSFDTCCELMLIASKRINVLVHPNIYSPEDTCDHSISSNTDEYDSEDDTVLIE